MCPFVLGLGHTRVCVLGGAPEVAQRQPLRVRGAQVRGNQFGSGTVTDNLCECCTVVDQPPAQRCVDVVAEV
eukprot:COSAG02_NODE_773_length_17343_cov_61.240373_7_plen_72_part_00